MSRQSHYCQYWTWTGSRLTMSSERSLARVIDSTSSSGTTVVNQDRDEIWGISCPTHTRSNMLEFLSLYKTYFVISEQNVKIIMR